MTAQLGSSEHAARVATGELLKQGFTRLTALVGGYIASFGNICWQTDTRISEYLRRPDGRTYHPESIARVRRQLRDASIITSERVYVGAKIPGAKYTSSRGTTLKTFRWSAIAQKNPFSRREQRLRRQEQARVSKQSGELEPPKARHVAVFEPPQYRTTTPDLDPELARVIAGARGAHEQLAEHRQRAHVAASPLPGRAPPE